MCGRFTREFTWAEVHDFLDLKLPAGSEQGEAALAGWQRPSYNVAPSRFTPVASRAGDGSIRVDPMRWGLRPAWARELGAEPINARAESAHAKPMFRGAFRHRRCLIPASGFYEWAAVEGARRKRPHYVHPAGGGHLCFAGLHEWHKAGGERIHTFTILTVAANPALRGLHPRMPVVLTPEKWAAWLAWEAEPEALRALLVPAPEGLMVHHPVSGRVNSPAHDDPSLIEPVRVVDPDPEAGLFQRVRGSGCVP